MAPGQPRFKHVPHNAPDIRKGKVWHRQVIEYPGEDSPLPGQDYREFLAGYVRRASADVLGLNILDADTRAAEIERRNHGVPLRDEQVEELIVWLDTAEPTGRLWE